MQGRNITMPVLILLFAANTAFCQTEMLKSVVNNLAFYNQKKDLKFLSNAKKSVDSLIITRSDSLDVEKNVYRAVVNASILYIDSLNKLNQPAVFYKQTVELVDKLSANKRIYRFQAEIDYSKKCLANVNIRKAFSYINKFDFVNALQLLLNARKYAPDFRPLNAYIAYTNNKLGNFGAAAKGYKELMNTDSAKTGYVEAASNIYKLMGDTISALEIVNKGRGLLPNDKVLILDEANIYNNKKDYRSLAPLLPALLNNNPDNADIAFVAANCYDHLNQYDKAELLYLRAIELNSSAHDPIFNLGLLYFKQSKVKKDHDAQNTLRAEQWLEKANEILPNNKGCLEVLRLVYTDTGNLDKLDKTNNQLKLLINN